MIVLTVPEQNLPLLIGRVFAHFQVLEALEDARNSPGGEALIGVVVQARFLPSRGA